MSNRNDSLPERVKELNEINILKSSTLIAFDWLAILVIIAVTEKFFSIPLYILAVMLIANRQHGLLILMHDASHFRFSKNRKVNDVIGELFTAWPLFIKMLAYRDKHLAHHKYSNTTQDPDFRPERYPRFRGVVIKMLIKDALALNTLEQFKEIKRFQIKTSRSYNILRVFFYLAVLIGVISLGAVNQYLMYWIVPAFTWLKVCLRLRSIADHTGLQANEVPFDTRTVVPNLFDRLFLAPHSSSYHFGHHKYAAVPCYNLKKLHNEMMNSNLAGKFHVTQGFINLLFEFPRNEEEIKQVEMEKGVSFTKNMPTQA